MIDNGSGHFVVVYALRVDEFAHLFLLYTHTKHKYIIYIQIEIQAARKSSAVSE